MTAGQRKVKVEKRCKEMTVLTYCVNVQMAASYRWIGVPSRLSVLLSSSVCFLFSRRRFVEAQTEHSKTLYIQCYEDQIKNKFKIRQQFSRFSFSAEKTIVFIVKLDIYVYMYIRKDSQSPTDDASFKFKQRKNQLVFLFVATE